MKKTFLLSLSLLFCPFFIESMDQQTNLTNEEEFPKVSQTQNKKPSRRDKRLLKSANQTVSQQDYGKLSVVKEDDKLSDSIENGLSNLIFEFDDPTKEKPIVDTNNNQTTIDNNIINNLKASSVEESYDRPTLSVFWNSIKGKTWTDVVNDDWINKEGNLEQKYHQRAKNELGKACDEQIKIMSQNSQNILQIKSAIEMYELIMNAFDSKKSLKEQGQYQEQMHKAIIAFKNYVHANEIPCNHLNDFIVKPQNRGFNIEDTTLLQRIHQTLNQERSREHALLLAIYMHSQNRIQKLTSTLNHIVEMVPEETKKTIQVKYPAFNKDELDHSSDDVFLKDIKMNKNQLKNILEKK